MIALIEVHARATWFRYRLSPGSPFCREPGIHVHKHRNRCSARDPHMAVEVVPGYSHDFPERR